MIEAGLKKLKEQYDASNSSLMVIQDGNAWKLTVRERYLQFVRKIAMQTELKKSVMETLAVIAYKAPMMQSGLIKIRTNKAYDHLAQLEEEGYITRKKKGRSKEIFLAPKFFEYFDIPEQSLRDRFKSVQEIENAVTHVEDRLKERKVEIAKQQAHAKLKEEEHQASKEKKSRDLDQAIKDHPVIELMDDQGLSHELETFDEQVQEVNEPLPMNLEVFENKLGDLQVVKSEPRLEMSEGSITSLGEMEVVEESSEQVENKFEEDEILGKRKGKRMEEAKETSEIDRRVAEIMGGLNPGESKESEDESDKEASSENKAEAIDADDINADENNADEISDDNSHHSLEVRSDDNSDHRNDDNNDPNKMGSASNSKTDSEEEPALSNSSNRAGQSKQ